jgi:secreted trypsin-like serine protease
MKTFLFSTIVVCIYLTNHHAAASQEVYAPLDFDTKIIGGVPVQGQEFPFFVQSEGCGGILVAKDVVLTAAHCNGTSF